MEPPCNAELPKNIMKERLLLQHKKKVLKKITFVLITYVCVYCVCVCGRKRERDKERSELLEFTVINFTELWNRPIDLQVHCFI